MKIKKVKRAEHTFIKNGREDAEQSVDETSGLKAEGNGPRRDIAAPPETLHNFVVRTNDGV